MEGVRGGERPNMLPLLVLPVWRSVKLQTVLLLVWRSARAAGAWAAVACCWRDGAGGCLGRLAAAATGVLLPS